MSDKKSKLDAIVTGEPVIVQSAELKQQGADNEANKEPNKARRNALLGAATGASLVAWHKPIVTSMLVPAHAQTSEEVPPTEPPPPPPPPAVAAAFFGSNVSAGPLVQAGDSLLDLLVPVAIAGDMSAAPYTISVVPVGTDGDSFTISVFEDLGSLEGFDVAQVIYSGQVSVSGGGSLAASDNPCGLTGLTDIQVEIADVGADSVTLNFTNRSQSVLVPAGDGSLPMPMCSEAAQALNFMVQGFSPNSLMVTSRPSLLDMIIPVANAGIEVMQPEQRIYTINAAETTPGSGSFEITLLERIEGPNFSQAYSVLESTFQGTVASSGSGSLSLLTPGCDDAPMDSIAVTINSVSENELALSVDSREFLVTLTPGSVMIGTPMCQAIATASSYFQPGGGQGLQGNFKQAPNNSLLDFLIPEAVAGGPSPTDFGISAVKMGEFEFQVQMLNPGGDLIRTGTLNINGDEGTLFAPMAPTCLVEGTPADVPAMITAIDEFQIQIVIQRSRGGSVTLNVPAGSGDLIEFCFE